MDRTVIALRALLGGDDPQRRQEVADAIDANEQYLYQIAKGIPLKSGKPRTVGRQLREKLDARFPGWLETAPTTSHPPAKPSIGEALPVVLGLLPGLPSYRAKQVVQAFEAAASDPQAPLETIERDLIAWLTEPRLADTQADPGKRTGTR